MITSIPFVSSFAWPVRRILSSPFVLRVTRVDGPEPEFNLIVVIHWYIGLRGAIPVLYFVWVLCFYLGMVSSSLSSSCLIPI